MALNQTMSDVESNRRQPRKINDQGTKKQQDVRKSARLKEIRSRKQSISESNLTSNPSPSNVPVDRKALQRPQILQKPSKPQQKRKRSHEARDSSPQDHDQPPSKRPRTSPSSCTADERSANDISDNITEPIQYWVWTGQWPKRLFEQNSQTREDLTKEDFEDESWSEHIMEDNVWGISYAEVGGIRYPLPVRRAQIQLQRKQSSSNLDGSSEQTRRKNQYLDTSFETILTVARSHMREFDEIPENVNNLCQELLDSDQAVPQDSLFNNGIFTVACQKIVSRNEARVVQDVARLIVPSAETLATYGAKHLRLLVEGVSEGWLASIPVKPCPQPYPDYSVGFRKSAFSDEQSDKLRVLVGSGIYDGIDSSLFVANHRMYFPFFTCEVKCGDASLNVADRQNAHSMTLALRAIVELYRLVKREKELHGEILGFSISHDHSSVRIYGHYVIFEQDKVSFYRHPIHSFDFTALNGKEKWTAYKFTRNIYDIWMPIHHKRICSAIDGLPLGVDFNLSQAATFAQSEVEFKKPDQPAGKKQKTELSSVNDQLANQERQSKEQMAQVERLYQEQMAQQKEQMAQQREQMAQQREQMVQQETRMAQQEKEHKEQLANQDKQHKENIAHLDKQHKEQMDMFKQLLEIRSRN